MFVQKNKQYLKSSELYYYTMSKRKRTALLRVAELMNRYNFTYEQVTNACIGEIEEEEVN